MTEAKEIAKEVAKELKRTQSIVVTATDIALMCADTPGSTPVRQILEDPTFPPCVSLVEGGTCCCGRAPNTRRKMLPPSLSPQGC